MHVSILLFGSWFFGRTLGPWPYWNEIEQSKRQGGSETGW